MSRSSSWRPSRSSWRTAGSRRRQGHPPVARDHRPAAPGALHAWHSRVLASEPRSSPAAAAGTDLGVRGLLNILNNLKGDLAYLFNFRDTGLDEFLVPSRLSVRPAWDGPSVPRRAVASGVARGPGWRRLPSLGSRYSGRALPARPPAVLLFYWWAPLRRPAGRALLLPICLLFAVLSAVLVRDLQEGGDPGPAGSPPWAWESGSSTGGMPADRRQGSTPTRTSPCRELDWEHTRSSRPRPGPILVIFKQVDDPLHPPAHRGRDQRRRGAEGRADPLPPGAGHVLKDVLVSAGAASGRRSDGDFRRRSRRPDAAGLPPGDDRREALWGADRPPEPDRVDRPAAARSDAPAPGALQAVPAAVDQRRPVLQRAPMVADSPLRRSAGR